MAQIFKKGIKTKSIYEMANEQGKQEILPSIDSYGDSRVYMRYKQNKWFEGMNVIKLKKEQAHAQMMLLQELYERQNKVEKEIARKLKL